MLEVVCAQSLSLDDSSRPTYGVTRFGEFLDFGQSFKAFGNN